MVDLRALDMLDDLCVSRSVATGWHSCNNSQLIGLGILNDLLGIHREEIDEKGVISRSRSVQNSLRGGRGTKAYGVPSLAQCCCRGEALFF